MFFIPLQHYGMGIIARELQLDQGHPHIHSLFLAVYKNFVQVFKLIKLFVELLSSFSSHGLLIYLPQLYFIIWGCSSLGFNDDNHILQSYFSLMKSNGH